MIINNYLLMMPNQLVELLSTSGWFECVKNLNTAFWNNLHSFGIRNYAD